MKQYIILEQSNARYATTKEDHYGVRNVFHTGLHDTLETLETYDNLYIHCDIRCEAVIRMSGYFNKKTCSLRILNINIPVIVLPNIKPVGAIILYQLPS